LPKLIYCFFVFQGKTVCLRLGLVNPIYGKQAGYSCNTLTSLSRSNCHKKWPIGYLLDVCYKYVNVSLYWTELSIENM